MRLPELLRRTAAAGFCVTACVATARAQAVRGVVVDRADAPVAGVVVQLLDASSRSAGRALTNERGEYRIVAHAAGSYRLHTLRIGFRPTDSAPIVLREGADVAQRIVLTGLPIGLDTVRVAGRNACRALSDSGAAFAVWEQIRAAVTAASLTAADRNVYTTVVAFERTLEGDGRRVRTQSSAVHSGYVREPWLSLSPDSLHRVGYVVDQPDNSTIYYAPGLDALLSPRFVEDHCFKVATDRDRIGLSFEPAPDRSKVPEIRGTLWLDRATAELRRLDFRYANILPEQDAVAHGLATFARLADGTWAISHWEIYMPALEQVSRPHDQGGVQLRVAEVHVAGGELSLARRGTDTLWRRPPLTLSGTVLDSATGGAIAGARVRLAGTDAVAATDAGGRFSLPGLLLGDYTLEVRTASLDSVNALHQMPVSFTDSSTSILVRVPNATQLMALLCGGRKLEWPGVVFGMVTSPGDSAPPRNVRVVAEWTQMMMPAGGQTIADVGRHQQFVETRTDARGLFRLCGVPIDHAVALTAGDEKGHPVNVRIPATGRFARAELSIDRGPRADYAVFVGTVVDSTGKPLMTANVSLPALEQVAVTDERGGFRLGGIPAGRQRVVVRHLGFRAIDTSLVFSAERTVPRRFELTRAVMLDSVVVTESAYDRVMDTFEENRRLGLGQFMTRAELAKLENGPSTYAILESFLGIAMVRGPQGQSWLTARHGHASVKPDVGPVACYSQVYLDNMIVYAARDGEPLFDVNTVRADQIEAIEYYANPAQTPARYSGLNSGCGVLVLWTRRFHAKSDTLPPPG